MGRRLRVDYSNEGSAGTGGIDGASKDGADGQQAAQPLQQPAQPGLPPLPPGAELPPGLTCPDAISRTLSTLPAPQLLDILSQMKGLVTSDPAKATELLRQAPQLSYAIFQALLLLNLVDTNVLSSVVQQAAQAPAPLPQQQAPPLPPPGHLPPPHQMPGQPPLSMYPPQPGQPGAPPVPQYPPHFAHLQPGMQHAPTPPPQYQQPPQQAVPPPQAQAPPQQGMDQQAIIRQVLALPQAQIDAMEPGARAQIMAYRQSLIGMGYRPLA